MSLRGRVGRLLGLGRTGSSWFEKRVKGRKEEEEGPGSLRLRRWEAARTHRLNKGHWSGVTGQLINRDLYEWQETLRARCAYEAANNPFVEGMVATYVAHCIGRGYPMLQVQTEDRGYADWLEGVWSSWWEKPDVAGVLSGPDMVGQWLRGLILTGEFLVLETKAEEGVKGIRFRIQSVDPRYLKTPLAKLGDNGIVLGVLRSEYGKPLVYYIEKPALGQWSLSSFEYAEYTAEQLIHGYDVLEPGQARGVPMLAPVLGVIADLRDYDAEVLEAARLATHYSVGLENMHPDAEAVTVDESVDLERATIWTAPPHHHVVGVTPPHPTTTYVEYRRERLAELGRVLMMPLLLLRLDASKHNYSSSRTDTQVYRQGIEYRRSWLERVVLNRLVSQVVREAELMAEGRKAPADVKYVWDWPGWPHVDPQKEAAGEALALESLTLAPSDAVRMRTGEAFDRHVAKLRRDRELLREAGFVGGAAPAGSEAGKGNGAGGLDEAAVKRLIEEALEEAEVEE